MAYVYPAEYLTPGAHLGALNTAGAQTLFVRGCDQGSNHHFRVGKKEMK